MAYDLNGTTQYLSTTSTPVTSVPLTFAIWFNTDATANMYLAYLLNSSSPSNFFRIQTRSTTAPIEMSRNDGGTLAFVRSTGTTPVNGTWNHACGVFTSSSSMTIYYNGGNSQTNTTSKTPTGIDSILIGDAGTGSNRFNGKLADFGIWDTDLTADEIASLAKGMTCDKVRPESLVFYAPLVRDLQDTKGGLTITNNNSATVAVHPRVYA